MNQISVDFVPCSPAPANGYQVLWRVKGSTGFYIDAGNFMTSPAVFTDGTNPDGTQYEGEIRADCGGGLYGPLFYWATIIDNSSCGTAITADTPGNAYISYPYILHVEGSASVTLSYDAYDRPNRFNLYDNGVQIFTSGWKGNGPYPGPWGASLATGPANGTFTFVPLIGHEYKLIVEVGPSGPPPYDLSDNFIVMVNCS